MSSLTRYTVDGVTLLGDVRRPGGVAFAFTERTGGVSDGPYASLNLGDACGDDPACVEENRSRALAALSPAADGSKLIVPRQVHGDTVVRLAACDGASIARAQSEARCGADAVVVSAPGVPVLLCFADCVPVVIVAEGGFAVIHSGWKGTYARIAAHAASALSRATGIHPSGMSAYIGPHILGDEYTVDEGLAARFAASFGAGVVGEGRTLDLGACIAATLGAAGFESGGIHDDLISCASEGARFFSYRASGGICGRQGALAIMGA